jgi:proline dehydrogenase
MTIEFAEFEGKVSYLTLFRNATSRPLYTAIIAKNSKIKRIEEKASRHQLKIAVMMKTGAKNELSHATINFMTFEDMKKYEEEFEAAVKKLQN